MIKKILHSLNASAAILPACLLLCSCGPRFDDAAALEGQGRILKAAAEYELFAAKKPADPRAPAALLKASRLYGGNLGLCARSIPPLETLARNYPDFKIPPEDYRRLYICPDYFPAEIGTRWVYGDTQSGGRNARQEITVKAVSGGRVTASYALYAGSTLVSRSTRNYRLAGRSFYEGQGGFDTIILDYPLGAGKTWPAKGPEGKLEFLVEKTGVNVKVKAGEFPDCVKVRRRAAGQASWVYDYYAPWTGKVLTAVGGPGYENRVTELIKYEKQP